MTHRSRYSGSRRRSSSLSTCGCSVRVWIRPRVKVGGRYPMDEGQIVVDSIESIDVGDITHDLARESGFASVDDLLQIARHGKGENVYLIRFHYLPPGGWEKM